MLRNLKSPNHNWIEPKSSKFNSLCNPNIANNLNIFHNFLKTHGNKFSCFFKRIYWSMITKTSCLSFFFFWHDISTAAGGLSCWVSKCSKWKEILLSFHERSFSFITLITMVVFVDNNVHIFLNLFLSFLDKSQNNNFFL